MHLLYVERVMHSISVPYFDPAKNGQNIVRFGFDLRITSYDDTMYLPIHGIYCYSNELYKSQLEITLIVADQLFPIEIDNQSLDGKS